MVKNIEDIKNNLQDKINSLLRERNQGIVDLDKKGKELEEAIDRLYSLDETKVKIICVRCRASGYIPGDDGKKHTCDTCNGRMYLWADKYIEKK